GSGQAFRHDRQPQARRHRQHHRQRVHGFGSPAAAGLRAGGTTGPPRAAALRRGDPQSRRAKVREHAMRAREPDASGHVERDGVKVHYDVFGKGPETLLLLPTWSIVHSRFWKAQIPYLARHYRVLTFDGRGNGLSDRPQGVEAYRTDEFIADAVAVMDVTDCERAVVVGVSLGGHFAAVLTARHPERVLGAVLVAPSAPFGPVIPGRSKQGFLEQKNSDQGWDKYNRYYWQRDYRGFLEF